LKEDTIPKPDGLAMVTESTDIERNSNNVEQCSKMIEDCSHCVRGSRNLPEGFQTAQSSSTATTCCTLSTDIRVRMLLESANSMLLEELLKGLCGSRLCLIL
jgi:hypothetical protein